ncbi:MAG: hypothetical protein CMI87_01175 [Pelagibacteraceae bacterium]|nr:hypothetical protein [Pelagibacteraceae bacterium]|tara:strand:+ start:2129 stop:2536 length:408 start_codon:yes stop_codon:yes gene_type:complete
MSSNTAETEDILKAIREMMGEETTKESLPKDVLELTEKVNLETTPSSNNNDNVENGILELTNIINDNKQEKTQYVADDNENISDIDIKKIELIIKDEIRSKYSSKIDEIIKNEIESIVSEKLSAIRVDFKDNQSS